jgi:glycine/D-amino acid oxidase-like deaminating enzyme
VEEARKDYDVAVVGGGLLGSCVAWGLGQSGARVAVLDEGDVAQRASRANFALVWVQSKGLGMPSYVDWTVRAARQWPMLAAQLLEQTGIDVHHSRPGGFHLALSDAELAARADTLARMKAQQGADTGTEILDREATRRMLPQIGPEVVGASYCPLDGHVNSLKFLRALHTGLKLSGVAYLPGRPVTAIAREGGAFRLTTPRGEIRAARVALAAGNANMRLAPMVGLNAPMAPTRGQILITERTTPFLRHPFGTLRQSDEGTVMIGDSKEDLLDDAVQNAGVNAVMADRARRMFPALGRLNIVRGWSGVRVMTQDGFPIYEESPTHPGAFVLCCHSGVTLAPNHAFDIAPMIARGALDADHIAPFTAERFRADDARPASRSA